jgi:hypothetical protein
VTDRSQNSDELISFKIDPISGRLTHTVRACLWLCVCAVCFLYSSLKGPFILCVYWHVGARPVVAHSRLQGSVLSTPTPVAVLQIN